MMETFLIIIFAAGIGIFHNSNKPTQYTLNMEDGSKTQIILHKNSQYACPLYCEADHIHQAIMCKTDQQINKHQSVYHITKNGETDLAVFCSIKNILSMNKLTPKAVKDRLPDVVSASTEE